MQATITRNRNLLQGVIISLLVSGYSLRADRLEAAEMQLQLDLARGGLNPYVAVWLETSDGKLVDNLALWYDLKKRDNRGSRWLRDLRQWWGISGASQSTPIDGITGATRPAGQHSLNLPTQRLADLPAGQYRLQVEVSRERGGDDIVSLPLRWPPTAAQNNQVKGTDLINSAALTLRP